ncbi:transposase (plasmid) [Klebsiella pneumoniae]|nr:transposase [Klebsiella pneumoniae]
MPLRITPSVAEQEGQQTETEATGAPQKHHYTLNQQVGSITSFAA